MQIYGTLSSRANRCLWMLEEMGQPYELVEKSAHPDDLQTAEYLRLNPNARIPTLVDGDLAVWESLAINLYPAQKFEGPMHSGSPEVQAQAILWLWQTLNGGSAVAKNNRRKFAAILAADVVGYSRLMETDEEGTLTRKPAAAPSYTPRNCESKH